jgi:hypothetical protein
LLLKKEKRCYVVQYCVSHKPPKSTSGIRFYYVNKEVKELD